MPCMISQPMSSVWSCLRRLGARASDAGPVLLGVCARGGGVVCVCWGACGAGLPTHQDEIVAKSVGSLPVPGSGATGARWNARRRRATRCAISGAVISSGFSGRISSHASMRPFSNVPSTCRHAARELQTCVLVSVRVAALPDRQSEGTKGRPDSTTIGQDLAERLRFPYTAAPSVQ